jgi:hypothetical protein
VCGDGNLSTFKADDVTTLWDQAGRLSHFKILLKRHKDLTFPHVLTFTFCLSLLDKSNLPATNFNCLRTLLYSARRLFPAASLHVFLCGEPQGDPNLVTIKTLNDLIRERLPADCTVFEPPHAFSSNVTSWNHPTRQAVFDTLRANLNL